MNRLSIALAALLFVACKDFSITTAPEFVELEDQGPEYAYRATTSDGVVLAVRIQKLPEEQRRLAFWEQAVTRSLREDGYAMVEAHDVQSADGVAGRSVRFGRDLDSKPFAYVTDLYLVSNKLVVVEAGGEKQVFEAVKASVEAMAKSVRVK